MATGDAKDTSQSVDFAERLPIELIQHIIAHLDDRVEDYYHEDRGNRRPIPCGLAACSLVCRAWSHICRARIFRAVSLKYGVHRRLSFLYSTAPHLYKRIRNLCITLSPSTFEDWIPDCTGRFTNVSELRLDAEFITGPILGVLSDFGIMSLLPTLRLKRLALDYWGVDEAMLDLIPILSACSNTLESLSLEIYEVYRQAEGSDSPLPPSVCLYALRNLNIISSICTPPPTNLIECPNLESLTVECTYGDSRWNIPSWIPASLSELILHGDPTLDFPDFITAIRPSILRITISRLRNYTLLDIMTWIGGWVGHLPDQTSLRQLAIVINGRHPSYSSLYPEVADYAPLCSVILPLFSRGGLEKISLNIAVYKKGTADDTIATSRAVGAVEEAFAPILEEVSVNGFQCITCDHGKVDALLVKNMVETFRDGRFV